MLSWRMFDSKRILLVVQVVADEVRYLVRQSDQVVRSGIIPLSADIATGARLNSAEGLRSLLTPHLENLAGGDVAIVLSSELIHRQMISLPIGLHQEELAYQASRHITQTLGMSLTDVYFDWILFEPESTLSECMMEIFVARQSEVALYRQAFDKNWNVRWVCPESLIWGNAYPKSKSPYVVCSVEQNSMFFWAVDTSGITSYSSRQFDGHTMAQAGFVYESDIVNGGAAVQLPTRFVVEEVSNALSQWLGSETMRALNTVYCVGAGVDWASAHIQLQKKLGLPVRPIDLTNVFTGTHISRPNSNLSILWYLSQQVQHSKPLNFWPVGLQERSKPQNRFVMEVVFAGLLSILCVSLTCAWLYWSGNKVLTINDALKNHLSQLQAESVNNQGGDVNNEILIRLQSKWRVERAGQLNWLVALADVSSQDVKFVSVKQVAENIVLTGVASSPDAATTALDQLAKKIDGYHHLKILKFENKSEVTKNAWRFEAQLQPGTAQTIEKPVVEVHPPQEAH